MFAANLYMVRECMTDGAPKDLRRTKCTYHIVKGFPAFQINQRQNFIHLCPPGSERTEGNILSKTEAGNNTTLLYSK